MFVTKDEIKSQVNKIINDNVNNDIVFIVANKGFGKYKLLHNIYDRYYDKSIIIVNGELFNDNSIVKNCFMHGIFEYLCRNNSVLVRRKLSNILTTRGKKVSLKSRIHLDFHVKLTSHELESLLDNFNIGELRKIYKEFSNNTALVMVMHEPYMTQRDKEYISDLKIEIGTEQITYIITLRPDTEGINLIQDMAQKKAGRVWLYPMLPKKNAFVYRDKTIDIPGMSLDSIRDQESYDEFKQAISQKDYYNQVLDLVDYLLISGINPLTVFTTAKEEISRTDLDYISKWSAKFMKEKPNRKDISNNAIVLHNGQFMWVDALAYYIFVNEGIENMILEMQNFYSAFLIEIQEWELNKQERNRIDLFLKKMSIINGNPIIPEFAIYTSKLTRWIREFSKEKSIKNRSEEEINKLLEELFTLNIGFSRFTLAMLLAISKETGRLGILDLGLSIIRNKFQLREIIEKRELESVKFFLEEAVLSCIRWNDVTLTLNICDTLICCKKNGYNINICIPTISNNHTIYSFLDEKLKNENIQIGDIIMGKKTVFFSYTSANEDIVDIFEAYFVSHGYDVKRDIRNINDYDSIDSFMKEIRTSDYVITFISDEYLRRDNCIYEITLLLKDDNFVDRTFPVVVENSVNDPNTYSIFSPRYLGEIVSFWQKEADELLIQLKDISEENRVELLEDYRRYKNHAQNVAKFMKWFRDRKVGVVSRGNPKERVYKAEDFADVIDQKILAKLSI